jgi:tRNA(Ile)-lysidine synthase
MQTLEKHVWGFILKENLFPDKKEPFSMILAISGGLDSMVLLHLMAKFYPSASLQVVHINHLTRPSENDKEANLVQDACHRLGINCHLFNFDGADRMKAEKKNFEMRAREFRYSCFAKIASKPQFSHAYICTAHHLDDSFEWSLMHMMKSSSLKPSLGIPLKRQNIRRPLLCVSRAQLKRYAHKNKIPYAHDSSNDCSDPERNFIRNEIVPKLRSRFPSYLKHYAFRSNSLWQLLNLKEKALVSSEVLENGGILLTISGSNQLKESDILPFILRLSQAKRGKIVDQLRRFILAIQNFTKNKALRRGPYLGPMTFSGGVLAYATAKKILLVHEDQNDVFNKSALRSIFLKS